jgi:hypothetical protein
VGYSTPNKRPGQRGFLRLERISPSVANVDNSPRNGFSRVSYISRVSNTSTMTAWRGFDKGWSSSVGSLHLDLGVLPDETHISTKRAPTQQEAWVPRQDADSRRSRHHQTSPSKGPEANRRLGRCTSRSGPQDSFSKCFDKDPVATVVGLLSCKRPGPSDPRGSDLSWGAR